MSKPGDVLPCLTQWITTLRDVISSVLKEHGDKNIIKRLEETMDSAFSLKHPDIEALQLFPIPLIIVPAKYDAFCDEDRYAGASR